MPESFVQVAVDSTGKKVRTRQRTVGANTIEEQYLIVQPHDRVPVSRNWYSTLRIPSQAATSTPLFTIWNGGTNIVSVRRMSVEVDTIIGKATGTIMPILRLYRLTAAPTGGTLLTPIQQDTNDAALGGSIEVRGDASADGTNSASALSAVANPTTPRWEQTMPSWGTTTLAGYMQPAVMTLAPDDPSLQSEDPLYLRASQGVALITQGASAIYGAGDWSLHVKAVVAEFTVP